MRKPSFHATSGDAPRPCPACESLRLTAFFEVSGVPGTTTLLIPTREEALAYPKGDIRLFFCEDCGFISNLLYDPRVTEYSERYEGTQAFSPTFDAYHRELAQSLIDRHGLRGRRALEVGCGQGEFLQLLCSIGDLEGIGFDPAVREDALQREPGLRLRLVRDLYSEAHGDIDADLYCCKMTLEHIPDVAAFVGMLRRSIGERPDAVVFVQVPEVGLILRKSQFYDVMHEHCSYFTPESLRYLFAAQGFEVIGTPIGYQGQHLSLEAHPGRPRRLEEPLDELRELCRSFAEHCAERAARWVEVIGSARDAGRRVVLWGSGSKATAFLNALDIESEIEGVVDINPNRWGMYLATCGQEIIAPDRLPERPPDLVIAVNPVYREEIRRQLAEMGLAPELLTLSA
jgi:SAM-dependent methyltransferase